MGIGPAWSSFPKADRGKDDWRSYNVVIMDTPASVRGSTSSTGGPSTSSGRTEKLSSNPDKV